MQDAGYVYVNIRLYLMSPATFASVKKGLSFIIFMKVKLSDFILQVWTYVIL